MNLLEFLYGHTDGKCHFNSDPSKSNHPNIIFNGNTVQNSANQKHLGLILFEKLTFNNHITSKLITVNKLTSTLRRFYHYILCDSLVPTRIMQMLYLTNPEMQLFLIELNKLNKMLF